MTRNVLVGYGGFCAVNLAIAYLTSNNRTGRQPGQNKLLDFNDSLLPLNLLARFVPQGAGAAVPPAGMPASGLLNPSPQTFLPDATTQTVFPTGTTTTF